MAADSFWPFTSTSEEDTQMNKKLIDEIVKKTAAHFPTFGGGRVNKWNPLSVALKDDPPQFAAGVDVEKVVRFIISKVGKK